MKSSGQGAFVRILDKEYCVNCPSEKEGELNEAAKYLDDQMRKIRKSGRVIGMERIAVMAALNIAYEFLALRENRDKPVTDFSDRIKLLHDKIDDALTKHPIKDEFEENNRVKNDGNLEEQQTKEFAASFETTLIDEQETV